MLSPGLMKVLERLPPYKKAVGTDLNDHPLYSDLPDGDMEFEKEDQELREQLETA